ATWEFWKADILAREKDQKGRRAYPKRVSLLLHRNQGCGATKRKHPVPRYLLYPRVSYALVSPGWQEVHFFGPDAQVRVVDRNQATTRPSGLAGRLGLWLSIKKLGAQYQCKGANTWPHSGRAKLSSAPVGAVAACDNPSKT